MCAQYTFPPCMPSHGMGWVPGRWQIYDQEWQHDLGDPMKNKNTGPCSIGTKTFKVAVAEHAFDVVRALPKNWAW